MKRDFGWGITTAVALAAVIGVSTQRGRRPEGETNARPAAPQAQSERAATSAEQLEHGPCAEIEKRLQDLLLGGDRTAIAAPASCYGDQAHPLNNDGQGDRLRAAAGNLRFVIATVPDPVHSHFPLSFDRTTEAIEEGASDDEYVYDSSWLPWEAEEAPYALMSDRDKAEDRRAQQEEQPGILLFRHRLRVHHGSRFVETPEVFEKGLVIFVVGEEPTQGIHRTQFKNATRWIAALKPRSREANASAPGHKSGAGQDAAPAMLPNGGILGPSFSGSLPSLAALLEDPELAKQWQPGNDPLLIYSGSVSEKNGLRWFNDVVVKQNPIRIASFKQNDDDLLDSYCSYLASEGFDLQNLAILSEDETAYGYIFARQDNPEAMGRANPSSCLQYQDRKTKQQAPTGLVRLFYPRGIAAMRAAYQKQSIFSASEQSSSSMEHRTLTSDFADQEGEQHDTIREYDPGQLAQSQEGVLQQIVSQLRAHHVEYIVLRSSNPLDQLFLAHYLRMTYPHGRIVTLGADVLLRRESGSARLSGIMTLTTYPLLSWEPHWTWSPKNPCERNDHSHRVYPDDSAEGLYVATRFLLNTDLQKKGEYLGISGFIPEDPTGTLQIPDYAPPAWMKSDGANPTALQRPTGWLSVLGRNDFWPVAALPIRDPSSPVQQSAVANGWCSADAWRSYCWLGTAAYSAAKNILFFWTIKPPPNHCGTFVLQAPMPFGTKVALFIVFAWCCFHLACCYWYSITSKPRHRAYFVCYPESGRRHRALIVLGSLALSVAATSLACACGVMATRDEILPEDRWACALVVLIVWVLAGLAVAINVAKQSDSTQGAERFSPLIAYCIGTIVYYHALYWCTERLLSSSNRIPVYWRSMNLTSGVSPAVPILVLCVGVYLWVWRALEGLALFGPDQPLLPEADSLQIQGANNSRLDWLNMFSRENAASPVLELCKTLPARSFALFCAALVGQWMLIWLLGVNSAEPIRTLGARSYAQFICFLISVAIAVMMSNALQLAWIWFGLRKILIHLDRLPLRRSMAAIRGISWSSVWKISGNVLDLRYKLLTSLLECARHFENSVERGTPGEASAEARPEESKASVSDDVKACLVTFDTARLEFAAWYAAGWKDERLRNQTQLQELQRRFATLAGLLLSQLLLPAWRSEQDDPLACGAAEGSEPGADPNGDPQATTHLPLHIRYAEKLVCFVYLGFIQNVMGRMRTLVMGIAGLFIAVTISLASYPFDPRTVVNGVMVLLFLFLGGIIVPVYAQMHRDPLLSALTSTKPGELDADFWIKLISFGAGPVLGLLATIFPEMTNFLFSWIAPGISSIK